MRHPLTLRERAWLAGQLRTVRGRGLRPGDQVAIDAAAIAAAGVVLGEDDRVVDIDGVDAAAASSLVAAVGDRGRAPGRAHRAAVATGASRCCENTS